MLKVDASACRVYMYYNIMRLFFHINFGIAGRSINTYVIVFVILWTKD